jgi:glycosyltransferase involved in cell wall biosynthesis
MRVSIVTISYNQSEFIHQAIASIADQNYGDLEHIIVDAGSFDGSRDIISSCHKTLHNTIFEPDEGPADGLNKGFQSATGSIYGFLNSDDFLLPGTVMKVAQFFDENHAVDVVSADSILIDEYGKPIRGLYSDHFSLPCYAYGAAFIAQPSTFFRSTIFHRIGGFNPTNRITWDGELFVDMALAGARFALVRDYWSCFRVHANSISGSSGSTQALTDYNRSIFTKIMRREPRGRDQILAFLYRARKHFYNPLGVLSHFHTKSSLARRLVSQSKL